MERVPPKIPLHADPAHLLPIVLVARLVVLLAVIRRAEIALRLRVRRGVVHDCGEEGVGVEAEERRVGVALGEGGGEGGEGGVPVGDGAGGDRVAPFAGEGHAVERGDGEEEEVAGAGGVELFFGAQGLVGCWDGGGIRG